MALSTFMFETQAMHAMNIIFIRHEDELITHKLKFKPVFTHQIFDTEFVYGYYNLSIDIYVAAHSARILVDYYYDGKMPIESKYGLVADDIVALLRPWFPNNITTNVEEFKAHINTSECDYVFGDCINCFQHQSENGTEVSYRIINCDVRNDEFKKFHQRFQSLIIMFIDAANFIDLNDENWRILYLYQESMINEKLQYCPVGFCTIYLFESTISAARISQFFIVPFLQKIGLGYKLLETTYSFLRESIINLDEIIVEKPNKIFNKMKDHLDISFLINDPVFSKEQVLEGYSDEMIFKARYAYKFSNNQSRKLYEILRFYYARDCPEEKDKCIQFVVRNRYLKYLREADAKSKVKTRNAKREKLTNQPEHIRHKYYHFQAEKEGQQFPNKIRTHLKYIEREHGANK